MSLKTIKAKFRVNFVQTGQGAETIFAHPVYGGSDENKSFSLATPSGTLSLTITNPAAMGVLKNGQEFYLDFTPIEGDMGA